MNEEIENILHREGIILASNKKRAMAFFIDEMLLSFLLVIALWDSFAQAVTMEQMINITNTFVLEYMLMKIIYQAFFVMQYGASIGKIVMRIRVIELRTIQTPSVIVSLNRAIFRVISELILYLGFLWGLLNPERQTWHDKTARTIVVDV
ncbi:RDD protein [Sulfurimonas gotlandica GD1]|uniref:RDD protein n=1 Tax=Sulfurimonas gotlandica (strain DSM 19862 / JCM 16533 / GD1) TaxID=929558 RepID=B6BM96_SULGG|nr:RDD family protein [Sulfurimonas gotlandica]EDZ61760.1 RDD protein [Sulfurimonas gotlandica GD1]EHP29326.1 RDD protein [Sulfurimonas gotlandica GD1]